jgi:hypothetical protein
MENIKKCINNAIFPIYQKYPELESFSFNIYHKYIDDECIFINEKYWEDYLEYYTEVYDGINACIEELTNINLIDKIIPISIIEDLEKIQKEFLRNKSKEPLVDLIQQWPELSKLVLKSLKKGISPLFVLGNGKNGYNIKTNRNGNVAITKYGK